ncbi:MAG: hypothetical protein AAB785_00575 [Patescibacteria group bacterium]
MKKNKKINQAFTLIEVLLASFVLEIGLLGIVGFYSYSFQISKIARQETTAANLASGLLDEKLAVSYDNLPIGPGLKTRYSTEEDSPFYDYWQKIDVVYITTELAESTNDTNMKKIVVTIFWPHDGGERSFQTATIKTRH